MFAAIAGAGDKLHSPTPESQVGCVTLSEKIKTPLTPLFVDQDAQDVAARIGIQPQNYFKFNGEILGSMKNFACPGLDSVFPPAVMEHEWLIVQLAQEFGEPENAIATIMTIESGGNPKAGSGAGAIGLFQSLADKFPARIQQIQDPEERLKAMQDPLENGRAGMRYFKLCLEVARENLPYEPSDPRVFAWALMGYNGGAGIIGDPERVADETWFYGDHVVRYLMDAEIAAGLRAKGFTRSEIRRKMANSTTIEERAYALGAFHARNEGDYTYTTYDQFQTLLAIPDPGRNPRTGGYLDGGWQTTEDTKEYRENPEVYTLKLNPANRIYWALGGIGLHRSMPSNLDPEKWRN